MTKCAYWDAAGRDPPCAAVPRDNLPTTTAHTQGEAINRHADYHEPPTPPGPSGR